MKNTGNRFLSRTAWAIDGLTEISGYLSGIAILVAALIITLAVILRYLHISTIWQIEAATYLIILSVFVGAAYTQKHEGHISIDLVTILMPAKTRDIIGIAGAVLGFIVAVVIARYSWPVWWQAIEFNEHSESLWGPHLAFPYLLIPLGMTLLALQYIVYIARKVNHFRQKHTAPAQVEKSETAERAKVEA